MDKITKQAYLLGYMSKQAYDWEKGTGSSVMNTLADWGDSMSSAGTTIKENAKKVLNPIDTATDYIEGRFDDKVKGYRKEFDDAIKGYKDDFKSLKDEASKGLRKGFTAAAAVPAVATGVSALYQNSQANKRHSELMSALKRGFGQNRKQIPQQAFRLQHGQNRTRNAYA